MSEGCTIAIIGAGFSGTALAINLLRLASERPLSIALISDAGWARGIAYARRPYPYLLNVPAGRMSASSADASEFLRFARRHLPRASAHDFLPRELYGDYLESTLAHAELVAPPAVRLQRVRGEAIALESARSAADTGVYLADGRMLRAARVVLAVGNPPPAALPGTEALHGHGGYTADPWAAPPRFRRGESVLLVGAGLTMVDVAVAGCAGARDLTLHAISRHGLRPAAQSSAGVREPAPDAAALLRAARSARGLLRSVRELAQELEARGGDWREAVLFVRTLVPALWRALPESERRRFLRHLRSHWEVHRHRLPPLTAATLAQLQRSGRLRVSAGRILVCEPHAGRIRVSWRARGERATQVLHVDRIVNCSGPQYDPRHVDSRLLRSLQAQGAALADPLGLGLLTGEHGALRDRSGRTSSRHFYLGPMLRPQGWETTAVPELRAHAERLAQHLLRGLPLRTKHGEYAPAPVAGLRA